MKIGDVIPYENNVKLHPKEQIDQIKSSIMQFGNNDPIAVDANNVIIEGHGRLMALQELGYEEVEVIRLGHLTEEQRKAYTLVHNQLTMNSGFDIELLKLELDEIVDIDMTEFDFDFEMDEPEPVVEEDEFEGQLPDDPKSKLGEVYQLGNHRLMCGDSTNADQINKLMDGKTADLVFTDPPYGMKKEIDGVTNDNLNYDDLLEFNKQWIPLTFEALKANGSWYCWGIDEPLMDIYGSILRPMTRANEITFRNLLTWDKGNGQGQNSELTRSFATADEKCLFVMKGVQGFNTNADNYFEGWDPIREYLNGEAKAVGGSKIWKDMLGNQMGSHYFTRSQWTFPTEENYLKMQAYAKRVKISAFERDYANLKREYEAIKNGFDGVKESYYATRAYFDNTHDNMNNVWHFPRTSTAEREETGGHATPKPIALCARGVMSSSREGEIVLDVFGGSGSTLIACEQLGRACYMMEYEPKYVDVIIDRWEAFTGEKAVKLKRKTQLK